MEAETGISAGTLLGGRVIYRQKVQGYRTGIEPVLLAAFVPARPGERVVEAGTGAGAGLLALCARVEKLSGSGLERDPALAELAAENLAANGFGDISVLRTTVETWRAEGEYDHAFANPPWHAASSTPSPDAGRRGAKLADDATLQAWVGALAAPLRHRGTLSLILPASQFARAAEALSAARCAEITLLPLWPRIGVAAKLVLMQGVRHGKGACRVLPGLALHTFEGGYTPATDRIVRGGGALELFA